MVGGPAATSVAEVPIARPKTYDAVKRGLDLAAAVTGLLLTLPLSVWIAIAIKRSSPGPIMYAGTRVGRGGRPFRMYKFRTMVPDADRNGVWSTADDDPRITRIGATLRRYKLDELPNLINVARGEMSLVGPRPQVPADVAKYIDEERKLLSVRPGITDRASIRFRNEGELLKGHSDPDAAYDRLIRPEKSRLGLLYVQQRSLALDLAILWDFVRVLLRLPGAPPAEPITPVKEQA